MGTIFVSKPDSFESINCGVWDFQKLIGHPSQNLRLQKSRNSRIQDSLNFRTVENQKIPRNCESMTPSVHDYGSLFENAEFQNTQIKLCSKICWAHGTNLIGRLNNCFRHCTVETILFIYNGSRLLENCQSMDNFNLWNIRLEKNSLLIVNKFIYS